ncbi:MAG: hypothetical protein ILP18_11785 [Treponema sp.]|nr:hypothetical protein [Treponema sp.]
MKRTILPFVAVLLACFAAVPVFAGFSSYGIPDSSEIRSEIASSWFEAPIALVRSKAEELYDDGAGHSFQVRIEEEGAFYKIIIAPKSVINVDYIKGGERKRVEASVYREGTAGTWILYREARSGKASKIRIHFNADPGVYLELRNGENKTFADMVLYDCYMVRSVPLGVRFKKLYSMSFDAIQALTKKSLPWSSLNVVPGQYHPVLQMAAVIRSCLPRMVYAFDAAYNEEGKLYSVQLNEPLDLSDEAVRKDPSLEQARQAANSGSGLVLSATGFLKWIADGIIEPSTGSFTKLGDMVAPTVNYSSLGKKGVISQTWNLSLTLDCCRNLAVEALNARSTKRSYRYKMGGSDETGVDVTVEPFVSDIVDGGELRSVGYIQDTGYSITELKSLLYVLAVTECQYIYFGAIKSGSKAGGGDSVFNNCAVFMPYFDDNGSFDCIVFEQGKEYVLDAFLDLHGDSFVHLERVKSTDYFQPMYR